MKASNTTTVSSGGLLTANSQSLFTAVASAPSPTPGQVRNSEYKYTYFIFFSFYLKV